jgi:hypothetical protein
MIAVVILAVVLGGVAAILAINALLPRTQLSRTNPNHAELARTVDRWLNDEMIECVIPEPEKNYAAKLVADYYGVKKLRP